MLLKLSPSVEDELREASGAKKRYLLLSFSGWPDAGKVASLTIECFVKSLEAVKLLDIDYFEIYDFTVNRPLVEIREGLLERLHLPRGSIYFWRSEEQDAAVAIFSGAEPSFGWRKFSDMLLNICSLISAQRIYLLGGVLDQVPHTRRPRISAVVNMEHLKIEAKLSGLELSEYNGPSSIHSYIMLRAKEVGLEAIGLWGHTPTYISYPNAIVAFHLASKLAELMKITVDLSELKSMAESLKLDLRRAMSENPELRRLVEEVERRYDERYGGPSYIA